MTHDEATRRVDEPVPTGRPSEVEAGRSTDVDRWLAEVRVEQAARERARLADLRARDTEEATLAGVLGDLAAQGRPVTVALRSGRRHRGAVRLVGPDAVVLALDPGQWVVLRSAAVASLRAVGADPVAGRSEASSTSRFEVLVSAVVEPGDPVALSSGSETATGRLEVAGSDMVTLRLDNGERAYVPLAGVDEVVFTPITA